MMLTELTDEVDFPIIYDLVRSKLTAGEKVYLRSRVGGPIYQVYNLSPAVGQQNYDVKLSWHVLYPDDPAKNNGASCFFVANRLLSWKLTKMDAGWDLLTP
jgi:hypothetical protein